MREGAMNAPQQSTTLADATKFRWRNFFKKLIAKVYPALNIIVKPFFGLPRVRCLSNLRDRHYFWRGWTRSGFYNTNSQLLLDGDLVLPDLLR